MIISIIETHDLVRHYFLSDVISGIQKNGCTEARIDKSCWCICLFVDVSLEEVPACNMVNIFRVTIL